MRYVLNYVLKQSLVVAVVFYFIKYFEIYPSLTKTASVGFLIFGLLLCIFLMITLYDLKDQNNLGTKEEK